MPNIKSLQEQTIGSKYVYSCPVCKVSVQHHTQVTEFLHDCSGPLRFGDYVALALKKLGIGVCQGCNKRKLWLNKVHNALMAVWSHNRRAADERRAIKQNPHKSSQGKL